MGTRHITAVKVDGEIKISQYGQWDGYFTGAGAQVQAFLKYADLEDFANRVRALSEYAYIIDLDNNTVEVECGAKPFNVYTIDEFIELDMQALDSLSYGE